MRELSEELRAFDALEQERIIDAMRAEHIQRLASQRRGESVEPHFLTTERVLLDVRRELDPLFRSIQVADFNNTNA